MSWLALKYLAASLRDHGSCRQQIRDQPRGHWVTIDSHILSSFTGAGRPALAHLPAEVLLVRSTPTLPALQVQQAAELGPGAEQGQDQPSTSLVLVTDGIPPIPSKVLEKIRKWKYVDLATLLANDTPSDNITTVVVNGQTLVVSSAANSTKKRRITWDSQSWSQAYSMYAARLISTDSTTRPESAGLLAHMFSLLQLAKDLGGSQWLHYDRSFREWAVAKNIRIWGELNLLIFCQCMASQQRVLPVAHPLEPGPKGSSVSEVRRCWVWNFCKRSGCRFSHSCYFCGGPHKSPNCPSRPSKGSGQ